MHDSDTGRGPQWWPRCPLMVDIALWYHHRQGDFEDRRRFTAPAVRGCLGRLVAAGMLEDRGPASCPRYVKTRGLSVWVERLVQTRFPVQRHEWVFE